MRANRRKRGNQRGGISRRRRGEQGPFGYPSGDIHTFSNLPPKPGAPALLFGLSFFTYTEAMCTAAAQLLLLTCESDAWWRAHSQDALLNWSLSPPGQAGFLHTGADSRGTLPGVSFTLRLLAAAGKQFTGDFLKQHADTVLRYLLEILGLAYSANCELRKHIKGFSAKYQFEFLDRNSPVAAEFRSGRICVASGTVARPDVSVIFRNADALRDLLFVPRPDILAAMLNQAIVVKGNLTYLYKLAFLAKHIQEKLTGRA